MLEVVKSRPEDSVPVRKFCKGLLMVMMKSLYPKLAVKNFGKLKEIVPLILLNV